MGDWRKGESIHNSRSRKTQARHLNDNGCTDATLFLIFLGGYWNI